MWNICQNHCEQFWRLDIEHDLKTLIKNWYLIWMNLKLKLKSTFVLAVACWNLLALGTDATQLCHEVQPKHPLPGLLPWAVRLSVQSRLPSQVKVHVHASLTELLVSQLQDASPGRGVQLILSNHDIPTLLESVLDALKTLMNSLKQFAGQQNMIGRILRHQQFGHVHQVSWELPPHNAAVVGFNGKGPFLATGNSI